MILWMALALFSDGAVAAGRSGAAHVATSLHAAVVVGLVRGSAFYVEDGVAVTNAHVVAGLKPGDAVVLRSASGEARAVLIAVSDRMDLAVLRAPRGFLPVAPMRHTPVTVGDHLSAAGVRVALAGASGAAAAAGPVRTAALSLRRFGPGMTAMLAGAGPGFSGGPVIDAAHQMVGMVAALGRGSHAASARSAFAPPNRSGAPEVFILAIVGVRSETRRLLHYAES